MYLLIDFLYNLILKKTTLVLQMGCISGPSYFHSMIAMHFWKQDFYTLLALRSSWLVSDYRTNCWNISIQCPSFSPQAQPKDAEQLFHALDCRVATLKGNDDRHSRRSSAAAAAAAPTIEEATSSSSPSPKTDNSPAKQAANNDPDDSCYGADSSSETSFVPRATESSSEGAADSTDVQSWGVSCCRPFFCCRCRWRLNQCLVTRVDFIHVISGKTLFSCESIDSSPFLFLCFLMMMMREVGRPSAFSVSATYWGALMMNLVTVNKAFFISHWKKLWSNDLFYLAVHNFVQICVNSNMQV